MKKIAVINQYSSAGGGSRFVRSWVTSFAKRYPNIEIGLFADATAVDRDGLYSIFKEHKNVKVYPLSRVDGLGKIAQVKKDEPAKTSSLKIKSGIKDFLKKFKIVKAAYRFIKFRIFKMEDPWYKFRFDKSVIKLLNTYDLIYLAWPYFVEPVNFEVPVFATFHDFNFKKNFGNFNPEYLKVLNRQVPAWLSLVKRKIVSTKFIGDELATFYPNAKNNINTVFLASFNITKQSSKRDLDKFNLKERQFILSPSNTSPHKNLGKLISAYGLIKNEVGMPLVLTGYGTDFIELVLENKISRHDSVYKDIKPLADIVKSSNLKLGKDLIPLGYVSDEEIDALIKGASLIVSTSLYEAGSGPGLDAWNAGTPIAFSNIPPHMEQLEFLGTKAWSFDPKDPKDIAEVIKEAISNPEKSKEMARQSKIAIDKYTWDDVAEGYYKVFKEAIEK